MKSCEMETYEQKQRRLFGRFHSMKAYLEELRRLLKVEKTADDIWSIVESDAFIQKGKALEWTMLHHEIFPFKDKAHLRKILENHIEDWNQPYGMFIDKSADCGLVGISSLHDINWDFNFQDEPGGIICLTRRDYKEHIVLEYDIEEGMELFEIKIMLHKPL